MKGRCDVSDAGSDARDVWRPRKFSTVPQCTHFEEGAKSIFKLKKGGGEVRGLPDDYFEVDWLLESNRWMKVEEFTDENGEKRNAVRMYPGASNLSIWVADSTTVNADRYL